jgi:polyhydroxybutyrate depolymerase
MKPNRPMVHVFTALVAIIFIATGVLGITSAGAAQAQTADPAPTLRERIQEKIKARRAAKQDSTQSAGNGEADGKADAAAVLSKPGTYPFKLQHGGQERTYLIHIPTGYRSDTPAPVVFAFHGGGGNMQLQAGDNYGLVNKSDSAGFIAVFPNGYSRFPGGKLATWNAGSCCAQARDENIDDVGFVRSIWARLAQQVSVDRRRVYATGMSNGAMMSYRLACEMSDVFTAIAPVAGTDNTLQCVPGGPVSVLHIHAQDDDHVLFNGGAGEAAFKDSKKVADFVSVPDTIARWTQRNQCTGAPQRLIVVPGAYCDAYASCAGGAQVELCVTDTGGHSWPGGSKPRAGKADVSQAINANDTMWDFFERVSNLK